MTRRVPAGRTLPHLIVMMNKKGSLTMRVFRCAFIALVALALSACGGTSSTACYDDPPPALSVSEFRVSQTNQTLANSIPLLAGRAAGVRVELVANVARGARAETRARVDAVTSDGERTTVLDVTFDCVRSKMVAVAHVDDVTVREAERYELAATRPGAGTLLERVVAPLVTFEEPFRLAFVPIIVNGVTPDHFTTATLAAWSERASKVFPVRESYATLAAFDAGTHAGYPTSAEARYAVHAAFAQYAWALVGAGLEPEDTIFVGFLPSLPNGGGIGSTGHATTGDSLRTFLHEVGHALRVPHAVGCNATYPEPGTTMHVTPIGYDVRRQNWVSGTDFMNYCPSESLWISAQLYAIAIEYLIEFRNPPSYFSAQSAAERRPRVIVMGGHHHH
jgi:hypothetical protein